METRIPRSISTTRTPSGGAEQAPVEPAGESRTSSTAASIALEERGRTGSERARIPGLRSPRSSLSPSGGLSVAERIGRTVQNDLSQSAAWTPLTEVEAHVLAQGYCEERLLRALKFAVQSAKFSFSIRHPGGPDTMECHQARAPAKGHDIDAKTAKDKTMVEAYGEAEGRRRLQMLRDVGRSMGGATLAGRVGVWSEDRKQLLGFYLVDKVNQWESSNNQAKRDIFKVSQPVPYTDAQLAWRHAHGETLYRYLPIDFDRLEDSLRPLFALPDWSTKVFGGDLDIHDLRYPQKSFVGEGSPDENRIYECLHMAVGAVYPYRAPKTRRTDMLLFPHGPQQNYAAFAMARERGKEAVVSLTKVDLPVCAFVYDAPTKSAQVLHFDDTEEDRQRYEAHFPPKKNTSHYVTNEEGGLKLVRTTSVQSVRNAPSNTGSPRGSVSRGRARGLSSSSRATVEASVPAPWQPGFDDEAGPSSGTPIQWRSPFADPAPFAPPSLPSSSAWRSDIVGPLGEAPPMGYEPKDLLAPPSVRPANRPVSIVQETAEPPDARLSAGDSTSPASPPSLVSSSPPGAHPGQGGRRRSSLAALRHFGNRILRRSPDRLEPPAQAEAPEQPEPAVAVLVPAPAPGPVAAARSRRRERAAEAFNAFIARYRRGRNPGGAT